jgi:PhoH-like ATPase
MVELDSQPVNCLFILDTNVLMDDPAAIFRFHEHDVYIPMVVLEELDAAKKGVSEVARNVRAVSRQIDELIDSADQDAIARGVPLPASAGRLFLQTQALAQELPPTLPGKGADNTILATATALQRARAAASVVLVSKDINLRIKAHVLGIRAEDYFRDRVLDDVTLLYTGLRALPTTITTTGTATSPGDGRTWCQVDAPNGCYYPNECLFHREDEDFAVIVREAPERGRGPVTVEVACDYRTAHTVWGIHARNREQNFALNLLMDPGLDFVSLLGQAGTGKTLLALAAGLAQTLEEKRYREIVMTRATVPVGEDIGFLPGTEEEKMTPWMGALMDNLEVLTQAENVGEWGRAATNDLIHSRIRVRSLNFMRGRTFLNRYIIIDEAQNLTQKQVKTLITRAGPGTKVVCVGNVAQIDTPYLSETTSGLTYVVDRFKEWKHGGHITLTRGERSRLADFATAVL